MRVTCTKVTGLLTGDKGHRLSLQSIASLTGLGWAGNQGQRVALSPVMPGGRGGQRGRWLRVAPAPPSPTPLPSTRLGRGRVHCPPVCGPLGLEDEEPLQRLKDSCVFQARPRPRPSASASVGAQFSSLSLLGRILCPDRLQGSPCPRAEPRILSSHRLE